MQTADEQTRAEVATSCPPICHVLSVCLSIYLSGCHAIHAMYIYVLVCVCVVAATHKQIVCQRRLAAELALCHYFLFIKRLFIYIHAGKTYNL